MKSHYRLAIFTREWWVNGYWLFFVFDLLSLLSIFLMIKLYRQIGGDFEHYPAAIVPFAGFGGIVGGVIFLHISHIKWKWDKKHRKHL